MLFQSSYAIWLPNILVEIELPLFKLADFNDELVLYRIKNIWRDSGNDNSTICGFNFCISRPFKTVTLKKLKLENFTKHLSLRT